MKNHLIILTLAFGTDGGVSPKRFTPPLTEWFARFARPASKKHSGNNRKLRP